MDTKRKLLVLATLITFIILCVLLYLDRLESDGNIVFKTIQEIDTRILLAINPDGDIFFLNAFFLFITTYLDIAVPLAVFVLFVLSFYVEPLKRFQFILSVILIVFLDNSLATGLLKEAFGRARPQRITVGDYYFGEINPLEMQLGTTSFPSGHTSSSFALMVPLMIYLRPLWQRALCLTYACLQGISRMWVGVHFPSDVLMGAILGTLVAVIFYYTIREVILRAKPEDLR